MTSLAKISFCLTTAEAAAVDEARRRLGRQGAIHNRSEVIRAAIGALAELSEEKLLEATEKTQRLKPGRQAR